MRCPARRGPPRPCARRHEVRGRRRGSGALRECPPPLSRAAGSRRERRRRRLGGRSTSRARSRTRNVRLLGVRLADRLEQGGPRPSAADHPQDPALPDGGTLQLAPRVLGDLPVAEGPTIGAPPGDGGRELEVRLGGSCRASARGWPAGPVRRGSGMRWTTARMPAAARATRRWWRAAPQLTVRSLPSASVAGSQRVRSALRCTTPPAERPVPRLAVVHRRCA